MAARLRFQPLVRFGLRVGASAVGMAGHRLVHGPLHPRWTWRVEFIARMLQFQAELVPDLPPDQLRRRIDALGRWSPTPRGLRAEWGELAGRRALELAPSRGGDGHILYFHGGGYVICSPHTHRLLAGRMARAAGAKATVIDYRLAPEHPFPAGLDDCVAAYRTLLERGENPADIVLAGDSAGGGLAVATMLRLREAGLPLPRAAVLLSPWLDLSLSGGSIETNARFDYLRRSVLERFAGLYLNGADPEHPLASPFFAELAGLPPMLVLGGGAETLRSEIEGFARRARAAGVEAELVLWPGMMHAWEAFSAFLPEGDAAMDRAGRFVRTQLAARSASAAFTAS